MITHDSYSMFSMYSIHCFTVLILYGKIETVDESRVIAERESSNNTRKEDKQLFEYEHS